MEDHRAKWGLLADLIQATVSGISDQINPDLRALVAIEFAGFEWRGSEETSFAKALWLETLRQYLSGQGKPRDVCAMFWRLKFIFYYPRRIGRKYYACAYPTNNRGDAPDIAREAEAILAEFG